MNLKDLNELKDLQELDDLDIDNWEDYELLFISDEEYKAELRKMATNEQGELDIDILLEMLDSCLNSLEALAHDPRLEAIGDCELEDLLLATTGTLDAILHY